MSLITIIANNIEIDYVKESFSIKIENNALSTDFKVSHTSFPFLIIENKNTLLALGTRDITSVNKRKIIPVIVFEGNDKYYGELQILSYLKGFRKCNLKYSSDILAITNKKIADFMPVVSVVPGEIDPIPYLPESNEILPGYENWRDYPVSLIGKIYPEAKFNFPTYYWLNKFGVDNEEDDPWFDYQNHINGFDVDDSDMSFFIENTYEEVGGDPVVKNKNVASPQVFLLSPLHYIFESIGWTVAGNFINHELLRRTIMVSDKNNLSKLVVSASPELIVFDLPASWIFIEGFGQIRKDIYRQVKYFPVTVAGKYKIKFHFELLPHPSPPLFPDRAKTQLFINPPGGDNTKVLFNQYLFANYGNNYIIDGEVEFDAEVGNIYLEYNDTFQRQPVNYFMEILLQNSEKEFQMMHPTIELGRYVPDWTVGSYLSYLKTKFNLDISMDDFKKEITLNLNENIDDNEIPFVINQSIKNESYDLAAYTSFCIKYANDEDPSLIITKDEVKLYTGTKDDFTSIIQSKFKILPRNNYTSVLSDEIVSKEGIGLVIYDEYTAPFTAVNTESGFSLSIPGDKGIYESFHKRTIKFKLNASSCEFTGYFTENELNKIIKLKSVYLNNQRYRFIDLDAKEFSTTYQEVKFRLLSVNY